MTKHFEEKPSVSQQTTKGCLGKKPTYTGHKPELMTDGNGNHYRQSLIEASEELDKMYLYCECDGRGCNICMAIDNCKSIAKKLRISAGCVD